MRAKAKKKRSHGGRREGAGRKLLGEKPACRVHVYLPPEELAVLEALAKKLGVSRSALFREAARKFLRL